MAVYNFPDQLKGDTFKARQITFNFDITGARIDIQFKLIGSAQPVFFWSTFDNTITVSNTTTGVIIMTEKTINAASNIYLYDVQITDSNGKIQTYFGGKLKLIQDITRV
tara:strand:- start:225 stop:551 length:327 start_codon:yes stop_codon:yes gene_type:complete